MRTIFAAMLLIVSPNVVSPAVAAPAAKSEKPAGGKLPTFDVVSHCRDIAERVKPIEYYEICLRKEEAAREQLVKQWAQFHPVDRSHCAEFWEMSPEPTYTGLLSCLELARDASTGQR
jgi:hypothetical protein